LRASGKIAGDRGKKRGGGEQKTSLVKQIKTWGKKGICLKGWFEERRGKVVSVPVESGNYHGCVRGSCEGKNGRKEKMSACVERCCEEKTS